MKYKQEIFLKELAKLFYRYAIDSVCADSDGKIGFSSNGEKLSIGEYSNGTFTGISIDCEDLDCFEDE